MPTPKRPSSKPTATSRRTAGRKVASRAKPASAASARRKPAGRTPAAAKARPAAQSRGTGQSRATPRARAAAGRAVAHTRASAPAQQFTPSYAAESPFVQRGLRSFWEYRDLGVADGSQGQVKATVLRAVGASPPGGTGWHFHDLDFQFYYVLKGQLTTNVEGKGRITFRAGDSWLQPPRTKHNVFEFSADLELLEVIAPADFGTTECPPPA